MLSQNAKTLGQIDSLCNTWKPNQTEPTWNKHILCFYIHMVVSELLLQWCNCHFYVCQKMEPIFSNDVTTDLNISIRILFSQLLVFGLFFYYIFFLEQNSKIIKNRNINKRGYMQLIPFYMQSKASFKHKAYIQLE